MTLRLHIVGSEFEITDLKLDVSNISVRELPLKIPANAAHPGLRDPRRKLRYEMLFASVRILVRTVFMPDIRSFSTCLSSMITVRNSSTCSVLVRLATELGSHSLSEQRFTMNFEAVSRNSFEIHCEALMRFITDLCNKIVCLFSIASMFDYTIQSDLKRKSFKSYRSQTLQKKPIAGVRNMAENGAAVANNALGCQ